MADLIWEPSHGWSKSYLLWCKQAVLSVIYKMQLPCWAKKLLSLYDSIIMITNWSIFLANDRVLNKYISHWPGINSHVKCIHVYIHWLWLGGGLSEMGVIYNNHSDLSKSSIISSWIHNNIYESNNNSIFIWGGGQINNSCIVRNTLRVLLNTFKHALTLCSCYDNTFTPFSHK